MLYPARKSDNFGKSIHAWFTELNGGTGTFSKETGGMSYRIASSNLP